MVGGMISSTVLTLAEIPAIYALVKQWRLKKGMEGVGMRGYIAQRPLQCRIGAR